MFIQFVQNHWKLLVLCLVGAIFMFIWLYLKRKDLRVKWWGVVLLIVGALLVCILGQIALAQLENLIVGEHLSNMRAFGALFIYWPYILICSKITKTNYKKCANILTIAGIILWFFNRFNCYVVGCCYGRLVSTTSSFRYPVREIEMAWVVFFLCYLIPKVYKNKENINIFYLFLFVYGGLRVVCDFFREEVYEIAPHFYLSQVWALISFTLGGVFLFIDVWKLKKNKISGGGRCLVSTFAVANLAVKRSSLLPFALPNL